MFRIHTSKHGYVAILESTGDKYFIGDVKPTEGYPTKAKYPYKGRVALIKNDKFIALPKSDASARAIYSSLMPEVCAHIAREKDIADRIRQDEEEQYSLLEQNLDDLSEF